MSLGAAGRTRRRIGVAITAVAALGGLAAGNLLSNGSLHVPFLGSAEGTGAAVVGLGLLPVLALLLLGVLLL